MGFLMYTQTASRGGYQGIYVVNYMDEERERLSGVIKGHD